MSVIDGVVKGVVPGTGIELGPNPTIDGALFTIVGYQVVTPGVFATIGDRTIKKLKDPVTNAVVEHLSLEPGATLGLGVLGVGAAYAGYLVVNWVQSGFTTVPFTLGSFAASVAIVRRADRVLSVP